MLTHVKYRVDSAPHGPAQPDVLDTSPLYHGRSGSSIHQSDLCACLGLQSFPLQDINRMRRPTGTSGGPAWPISKKDFFRFVFADDI